MSFLWNPPPARINRVKTEIINLLKQSLMKAKKSTRADLQGRRVLFFEIGFVVALVAAIAVFSVGQTERVIQEVKPLVPPVSYDLPPVTKQQEPPKIKPQMPQFIATGWNIVSNDKDIDTSGWVFPNDWDEPVIIPQIVDEDPVDGDPVWIVSDMPKFQGGDLAAFRNWVMGQMVYPRVAADNGIQGRVQLRFVIEKDGSVSNIELDFAPDRSLADEAMRVVAMSPKWEPGRHQNRPARVSFVLPIEFKLQ